MTKEQMLLYIRTAGEDEIDELLMEVMDRKQRLYPDLDIWYHAYKKKRVGKMKLEIRKVLERYRNHEK